MENIIQTELIKSSAAIYKNSQELGENYNNAMKKALEIFKVTGIPNKKNEDWIFTNISKHLSPRFFTKSNIETAHDVSKHIIDIRGVIIFNNGIFNRYQSVLPDGIVLDQQKISTDFYDSFDSLNFAASLSPLFLKIKKNTHLDFPITIIHLTDELAANKIVSPRINILAEEFSNTSFVEIFTSTQNDLLQYTTNSSTFFEIKESATLEHVKIQWEAKPSLSIGLLRATLGPHSQFKSITLDFGNATSRHNIDVILEGIDSTAHVDGLYLLDKSEHADIFSKIHHAHDYTTSGQLFKGILSGESHGVFTGKILIQENITQASSQQLNNNLMLSQKAHVNSRPQLLVSSDDVKCSHGATIGQLSFDEEFYLESRGIKKEKAKKMLTYGFGTEIIFKIKNIEIQNFSLHILEKKLKSMLIEGISL